MPAPIDNYANIAAQPSWRFSLEPASNLFHSLVLLAKAENISGLGDWVRKTRRKMSADELHRHELVVIGLHYTLTITRSFTSFPAYIEHLAAQDPLTLRDQMLDTYARINAKEGHLDYQEDQALLAPADYEQILASFDAYLAFLRLHFDEKYIDIELERQAYQYAIDPPAMQSLIVSHLRFMWDNFLAEEWERVRPMLQGCVNAFQQLDLSGKDKMEVIEQIIDQEMDCEWCYTAIEKADRIIFIPSAHIGPYMGKIMIGDTLGIVFGARLPKGAMSDIPDLSRTEILVRLSALADDTRLRILKLVAEEGELRSQDIIAALDLSQSAASRHLKQLSATGYLSERRCEGAKCYTLNRVRLTEALSATHSFLLGDEAYGAPYQMDRVRAVA